MHPKAPTVALALFLLLAFPLYAKEMIYIDQIQEDGRILVQRSSGDRLLLKNCAPDLARLLLEGQLCVAELSSGKARLYFEDHDPILCAIALGTSSENEAPPAPPQEAVTPPQAPETPTAEQFFGTSDFANTKNRSYVERLQEVLTELGYDTKGVDGIFGNNTRAAIREFQEATALTVLGEPNEETLNQLLRAQAKLLAPPPEAKPESSSAPPQVQADAAPAMPPTTPGAPFIESQIAGDFEGWAGDTIFRLVNDQVWRQVDGAYHDHYAHMPDVTLVPAGGGLYKMFVQGIDTSILVMRIH